MARLRTTASSGRQRLSVAVVGLSVSVVLSAFAANLAMPVKAQEPPATAPAAPVPPEPVMDQPAMAQPTITAPPVADPAAALQDKRNEIGRELQALSGSIKLSEEKAGELARSIAAIEKTSSSLRQALIESGARRKELERSMSDSEKTLAGFGVREDTIRLSFRERRAILAEVLAALQRMGRNPPPALLVSPEDALGSVRSAILLGAVVPGIRRETERLANDLAELANLRQASQKERDTLVANMQSRQEEERRMDMLLVENDKVARQNAGQLQEERARSEELARKASSLEGLIGSLEQEITSVREAMNEARAQEERQRRLTDEQRQRIRDLAETAVPDKNRIAPASLFSELKSKLELPAAGDVVRVFGDPDGTGHQAKGLVLAASPGALVTAPADGLVVFAGQFRSYGQMIILNMGDGYHVVLSGMDRVDTRQGKFVLSGEPLATMGEKRVASATALALETERPTLYIEFRKDGTPVDSAPWWVERDSGKADNDS